MSSERFFSLKEARQVLPHVRPVVERIVALNREINFIAQSEFQGKRLADTPVPFGYLQRLATMAVLDRQLADIGVMLKDRDTGLLDFPAMYGGRVVLLCWRLGEDDIGYWHDSKSGFAGRRPVSDLPPSVQPD